MKTPDKQLVTIIGGSGFVGTQLVQRLAREGFRIRVGVRRPDLAGHVRPLGSVGQIQPVQVNVRNFDSAARAVAGADTVINLAGIAYESGRQRFGAVHTSGAANVARAATEAGATRLVHMSALGADANSKSRFFASKAQGDEQVLNIFPKAIIMRPSIIFGSDDRFFNLFGALARLFPIVPVISAESRFQPVFVGDVAEALALATLGKVKAGKTYELGGPDVENMKELMERVLRVSNRNNILVNAPTRLTKFGAWFMQFLPNPWFTVDRIAQYGEDAIVSEAAKSEKRTAEGIGVSTQSMDAVLPTYMWRFRKSGQFEQLPTQ